MIKILTYAGQTAILATFALAQAPPDSKTYRGVLMDASCQAIQSRTSSTPSPSASSAVPSGAGVTPAATTGASPPSSTDASAPAAIKEAATSPAAAETKTTASSSVTTYSGSDATKKAGAQPATTHIGGTDNPTAERSRSAAETPDAALTLVREKFKDCRVTPTTKSFALMVNERLYRIDDASGLLRQRVTTAATGASDWNTVTITGTVTGDRISASSVQ